jgi:16S rRNA (uracil1498-N3)-methyltransferase
MKQFILDSPPDKGGRVRLSGKDYHYLVRVRRLASGEVFPALLPGGGGTLIRVISTDNDVLIGERLDEGRAAAVAGEAAAGDIPRIILFQALPKGVKMDLIVRQAAECEISEVVPFSSEYSVAKPPPGGKTERWERIIKEARQQSGSRTATALHRVLGMDELFAYWEELKKKSPSCRGIFFHQIPLEKASLHGYLYRKPELVSCAIGPEGGFSSAEAERFLNAGFKALALGGAVLRTETAALYGAAAIRTILLESDVWTLRLLPPGNG